MHDLILRTLKTNKTTTQADKFAKFFNVSEKRMWHLKLKAFADLNDWNKIEELTKGKKTTPVGWEAFAEMAMLQGRTDLAEFYFMKSGNVEE